MLDSSGRSIHTLPGTNTQAIAHLSSICEWALVAIRTGEIGLAARWHQDCRQATCDCVCHVHQEAQR